MPARRSVSVSPSPEPHAVVGRLPTSGRYGNFSEAIRAAVRLLDEREIDFHAHREARLADACERRTAER